MFNPYNKYSDENIEKTIDEQLKDDLLEDEIREQAEETLTINLDEHGNEIDPSVQEFLDERDEEPWMDNGNRRDW